MIKLGTPRAGWMDIQIGDNTFSVSYLVDVWAELDYLLNLKDDTYANKIQLDGESFGFLYLVAYLSNNEEVLNIVWQKNDDTPELLRFNYKEFMVEYNDEKEKIGFDNYTENFIMEARYEKVDDVDNYLYDYNILNKKYPDTTITVVEDIDYDYEENPYVSGYYLEIKNYKTNEVRCIEGE